MSGEKSQDQSFLKKPISRRSLFKAGVEFGKIGAAALLANELSKTGFSLNNTPTESTPDATATTEISAATPITSEPTDGHLRIGKTEIKPAITPIPEKKDSEVEIAGETFKKHMQYYPGLLNDNPAPKKWTDRNQFDPTKKTEVPDGIDGTNESILPSTYVQAQTNGHVMFCLFTPPDVPSNSRPSIIPRKGEVILS